MIPWLPESASKESTRIHFVYWFTTVIAIAVFAVVVAVMAYSVIHFRARPDDDSDGPPTHGHTTLEIVWTAIPAVLVTAISIVSAIVLAQNGRAGANPLVVKVTAQQFAWEFTYPNGKTYGYLTLPKGRHVKLEITAKDVIHSFWVPEFSQKQDAVPGPAQLARHHADAPRHVPGDLHRALRPRPRAHAQPRGRGHARQVRRLHEERRERRAARARRLPGRTAAAAATRSSRRARPATIGPDLDNLKAEAAKANRGPLDTFIEESIVDPAAYIAAGLLRRRCRTSSSSRSRRTS